LTYQQTAWDQIERVQNLSGIQNFNNITLRLHDILNSFHNNEQITNNNNQGYIHDHKQILLLNLEVRISHTRLNITLFHYDNY